MKPAWQIKLTEALKREPQKAAVLGTLAVVMVVMFWKTMGGASDPQAAGASPAPLHPATPAQPAQGPAEAGGRARSNDTAVALQEFLSRPISPLGRNLFAVQLDRYPTDGSRPVVQQAALPVETFWDELAKSMAARAERMSERQAQEDRIRAAARRLLLQSTVMGSQPKAMVNGQLVAEGDLVKPVTGEEDVAAWFRVLRIEPQRIIVERDGIKLTVRMLKNSDAR